MLRQALLLLAAATIEAFNFGAGVCIAQDSERTGRTRATQAHGATLLSQASPLLAVPARRSP